ncbi:MAG: hypothetical protein ACRDFB_00785 [Rhabdochlamydiaceae bacterium]
MNRNTKKFLALHERLIKEIDNNIELFLEQRSFLQNNEEPEEIKSRTDEEAEKYIQSEYALSEIVKEITRL